MERTADIRASSLPELTDPDSREEVPPEDTPVKTRQQPGYEPVGIRAGSWMFSPALTFGSFYDSNIFSSNTLKRSDIAAVVEPSLHAHTLWEQHGVDLTLDTQSTAYNRNPASIRPMRASRATPGSTYPTILPFLPIFRSPI